MAARPKHARSAEKLAALAGVSDTTWKAHVAQGCPVPRTDRDLVTWLPLYHAWRAEHGKVKPLAAVPPLDPETAAHKREHAKWRAMSAKIDVGVRTRQLINRDDVVAYMGKANLACRTRMNLLVQKLRARFGEEVGDEAQREVDSICEDFAQGMRTAHDNAARNGPAGHVAPAEATDGE